MGVDSRNRVLDGRAYWRHLANTVERLRAAAIGVDLPPGLATRPDSQIEGKGKVLPYSLPSVGPGADPGVDLQAISPQVT